jgi:hypothetical protein
VIEVACDRRPGIEVSATSARHSRVQSSITARIRNLRPSIIWSCTKSSDQRSFPPLACTVGCLEMDAGFPGICRFACDLTVHDVCFWRQLAATWGKTVVMSIL